MSRVSFRIEEIENRWIGKILISVLSRVKRQWVFFSFLFFTITASLSRLVDEPVDNRPMEFGKNIYLESRNWIKLAKKDVSDVIPSLNI